MENEIFKDRQRADEASYFRQQDARLIERLRQKAPLDEIAAALAEKLQVDNPDLLRRVRELDLTAETAPALFLAPLVQVAWSDGSVSSQEHDAVLRLAESRGTEVDSPVYAQLVKWLGARPSDETFDAAVEVIKYGFGVLPEDEKEERIKRIVEACNEVASASGGGLARVLGMGSGISGTEAATLDTIAGTLRQGG